MKKPARLAGLSLCLLFTILFCSCTKSKDLIAPSSSIKVIATTPGKDQLSIAYDGNVSAKLNTTADTSRFAVTLAVSYGDSIVKGTVTTTDSVICFIPEEEMLPLHSYTAMVTVKEKSAAWPPYTYQWTFTTKAPDEYAMTQRSDNVTDGNRDGNRSMQIGNYLYSFGGWKNPPEDSYSDVYRSSGDLSQWERLPDAPWHGRHVYGIANIAGSTYIIGGDNLHPQFDVWRTTDGETWTLLSQNVLGNRIYFGCTVHNGYIYIVGGSGYNDVWRSRDGTNWEQVANHVEFLKGECFTGSLASFNGKLWMVCGGGYGGGNGTPRKEVWSSTDGREWKQEKDFGGSERYYTDVCVWDNKLWVIGGYNYQEGNARSIWYMKPDGTWKEYVTPNGYIARHATGVAVYNNSLVITCGSYHNDCWAIEKIR